MPKEQFPHHIFQPKQEELNEQISDLNENAANVNQTTNVVNSGIDQLNSTIGAFNELLSIMPEEGVFIPQQNKRIEPKLNNVFFWKISQSTIDTSDKKSPKVL